MATISFKDVSGSSTDNASALRNFTLEIEDREFVVLTGPSGCGQSTALRVLAGLDEISNGDIFIGDRRVNGMAPKDRNVAMVFRDEALYPRMSVRENLAFGLKKRKFSETEIKKRIADAAEILRIQELLERKPKDLSNTQRQRVAIARALARKPKVLLFDEVLSHLEAASRAQLQTEIQKLRHRLDSTIIFTTRDPAEAMTLADRIVVMNTGAIEQEGAPLAIYNAPANLFVAEFLGAPPMNFLHGVLKQERESLVFFESGDGTIQLHWPISEIASGLDFVGKPAVLGVRPEDVRVVASANALESFPVIIDTIQRTGAGAILHVQTGSHSLLCATQGAIDGAANGRRLRIALDSKKAHLFDPISSRRIV